MKSSYGAVLTDCFFAWGRFNRKWGRFGLGPFSIGAVLTGNLFRPSAKIKTGNLDFLFFFHFWKKYGRRSRKPED